MVWWLRQFIRKRMNPIEPEVAAAHKKKLSIIYSLLAWNTFGFTVLFIMKENLPTIKGSVDYAKLLGVNESTVIRFVGFSKVAEYDLKLEDKEIDEFHNNKTEENKELDKIRKEENKEE